MRVKTERLEKDRLEKESEKRRESREDFRVEKES